MYKIHFFKDRRGNRPIAEYLKSLSEKTDKDSRIKFQKVRDYIAYLSEEGKQVCEPYIKHLQGEIWELRPLKDRVLFAAWDGKSFILLHHFVKKTQKTPFREIKQAERNLAEMRERGLNDE